MRERKYYKLTLIKYIGIDLQVRMFRNKIIPKSNAQVELML